MEDFRVSRTVRLSMSIDEPLLQRLEQLAGEHGYENRSELIRDLIRERLVREQWAGDAEVVGSITLLYNHHQRMLSERLTEVQHQHHDVILATTHVHLSHEICVELILARGRAGEIRHLADELRTMKGVLHADLSLSATGEALA